MFFNSKTKTENKQDLQSSNYLTLNLLICDGF